MHENPGQRLRYDGENAQRRGEAATLSGLGKCGDTDPGLRAARYPGCVSGVGINPERGCIGLFLHGRQSHFGGEDRMHENPGQRLRYDGENAQRRGEAATLSGLGKCGDTDPG